jgi:hypothetical protein
MMAATNAHAIDRFVANFGLLSVTSRAYVAPGLDPQRVCATGLRLRGQFRKE